MRIESPISLERSPLTDQQREELRKEQTAIQFEELFARHLVKEMTKSVFQMQGGTMGNNNSYHLYQEFVTDALATQLAAQKKLGMADLVSRHWDNASREVKDHE